MIVYVYPADLYGCGFYRLIAPARALRALGHDVRIVEPTDRQAMMDGEINNATNTLVRVTIPPDADVIVLQRVAHKHLSEAVSLIRAQGVAVVVDMDDDMAKIDPANPAFTGLHPSFGRSPLHNWNNAARACAAATLVTVSTPALLATYARNQPGVVVPNRVPAAYLDVEHVDSETFGWPGSVHSHPTDLGAVGPAVARLVRGGHQYLGVGPDDGLAAALGLEAPPPVTGGTTMEEWPSTLSRMGVGLAPLVDTQFNAAKSWLKPLELSAVGVPWVASPRAEYRRFHEQFGVGVLAERPNDWFKAIGRLLRSPALRREQSERGRQVAQLNTVEGWAERSWLAAWASAYRLERSRHSMWSKRSTG